jgi:hypothetical protein
VAEWCGLTLEAASNNGMHPTRDTVALTIPYSCVCGVRRYASAPRSGYHSGASAPLKCHSMKVFNSRMTVCSSFPSSMEQTAVYAHPEMRWPLRLVTLAGKYMESANSHYVFVTLGYEKYRDGQCQKNLRNLN